VSLAENLIDRDGFVVRGEVVLWDEHPGVESAGRHIPRLVSRGKERDQDRLSPVGLGIRLIKENNRLLLNLVARAGRVARSSFRRSWLFVIWLERYA
jgi:hypothetical protein